VETLFARAAIRDLTVPKETVTSVAEVMLVRFALINLEMAATTSGVFPVEERDADNCLSNVWTIFAVALLFVSEPTSDLIAQSE